MNSVTLLLGFLFVPFLLLVLIIVIEENIKETDKSVEEEPINMDDEDDWINDDE